MIFELLSLLVIVTFFTLTLARKSRKGPNLPPGPTPLPIIGHLHLIGPLIHHTFHNLASRYGPLMNIKLGSISVIVVSSPDLAREFLKTHDFFVAGTDTSAASLEWALSELINYPRVLQKAREEIDREAFRLHPSIPMITRKCVQECEIGGYRIPLNSMLFVNMWSIGRNPKYWDNPMEFRPERFLDNQVDMKGQHYELLPFGSGRRICAGMALALQELPAALAAVIQCFDFEVVGSGGEIVKGEKPVDMSERPGLTVPKATDLVCVPTARAGINLETLLSASSG
ncbi:Licodione synthase [Linum perenne]